MRAGLLLTLAACVLAILGVAAWWVVRDGSVSRGDAGAAVRAPGDGTPDGAADLVGAAAIALPPDGDVADVSATVAAPAGGAVPLAVPRRRVLPNPDGRPRLLGRVTRAGAPAAGLRVIACFIEALPDTPAGELLDALDPIWKQSQAELSDEAALQVLLDDEDGLASYFKWVSASTEADGRFVLPLPVAGGYELWLEHDVRDSGRWFDSVGVVVARGEAVELDLALPTGRLVGQLVHAATGEPLPWPGGEPPERPRRNEPYVPPSHVVRVVDGDDVLMRQVIADDAGRFEVADLPDGRYRVGVDRWSDEVVLVDGLPSIDELVVPVRPPARLRGLVRRRDGRRSFRREQLLLVPEQVPAWERSHVESDGWPSRSTGRVSYEPVTAEQQQHRTSIGSFDFTDLPPGRYRLAVGDHLTAEQVLATGMAVDASLGGLVELTLVTVD